MSYILDALQKSEADRHQEKLPGHLSNTKTMLFKRHGKQNFWPLIIVLLLMVNLGVLGYFVLRIDRDQLKEAGSVKSASYSEASSQNNSIAPTEQVQKSQTGNPASNVSDENLADSMSANIRSDQPVMTEEDLGNQTSDPMQLARAAIAEKKQQMKVAILMRDRAGSQADSNIGSEEIQPTEPYLVTPEQGYAGSTAVEDLEAQPADDLTQSDDFQVRSENADVPSISELDKSFQRTVPALVFNSHIYSSDPQGRRIMINDHYLREGQSFSGLKVEEITENGVVLSKNGQSFRVSVVRNWAPE